MFDKKTADGNFILARKTAKLLLPLFESYYRAKYFGLENIPDTPVLGVGNHLGVYFMPETYLWMGKYHTLKNKPSMNILVHNALLKAASIVKLPVEGFGVLDANPELAATALKSGNSVTVYPGGDRENSKPFKERNTIDFFEHYGYIQLALRAGVPILPIVGIGGGETLFVLSSGEKFAEISGLKKYLKIHTWPVYWSFPFGWHIGHFPFLSLPLPSQITISVLPPYSTEKYSPEDADNRDTLLKINSEITTLMQNEMDKLIKGRIPVIGKLEEK